ncbi:MarR family winged helix-turn-helix transcriptional regulator [Enterococcus sp. BWR-S5]|uniref:MarR family winged helix-turn-helix transcriptional regulator n=1 Tax=Enterococcus sp. BWR-S5 TaxID=2787714 RepID=UPI00192384B3|nr:MarR family transcriptional regulator [Enterococcus sp. BWR-S5]MBL1225736.1 MarR family transcriptional regulator [Enterococcus sp. BWR-S5]
MNFSTTESLSEQIYAIHNKQQEYIQMRLKKIDLNVQQARTLNYIFANPGTIQKSLAAYLGKQDATITNLLKSLEKKQLILRKIPDDNERQKQLYLTEKGSVVVEKIQALFSELEQTLSDLLSETELADAMQLMKKLNQPLIK